MPPLLGPTVRFPFVGSYFVERGFTGLVSAGKEFFRFISTFFFQFFTLITNCQKLIFLNVKHFLN